MKPLIKVMLILALLFASTFIALKLTGVITIDKIENWLEIAKLIDPIYVGILVSLLLFADLFIAMPTLTVMLLAGYFLGPLIGGIFSLLGVLLAGIVGYGISWHYGDVILKLLLKNKDERQSAIHTFNRHGVVIILLSRATPILPEVSACMSGLTKMPFRRFIAFWLISCVPYVFIATYAGAISTVENPKPAILASIGLTSFLWLSWYFFNRYNNSSIEH